MKIEHSMHTIRKRQTFVVIQKKRSLANIVMAGKIRGGKSRR